MAVNIKEAKEQQARNKILANPKLGSAYHRSPNNPTPFFAAGGTLKEWELIQKFKKNPMLTPSRGETQQGQIAPPRVEMPEGENAAAAAALIAMSPLINTLNGNKTSMENDPIYTNLVGTKQNEFKKKWQLEHPALPPNAPPQVKNTHDIDYLKAENKYVYGSTDSDEDNSETAHDHARQEFQSKHKKLYENYRKDELAEKIFTRNDPLLKQTAVRIEDRYKATERILHEQAKTQDPTLSLKKFKEQNKEKLAQIKEKVAQREVRRTENLAKDVKTEKSKFNSEHYQRWKEKTLLKHKNVSPEEKQLLQQELRRKYPARQRTSQVFQRTGRIYQDRLTSTVDRQIDRARNTRQFFRDLRQNPAETIKNVSSTINIVKQINIARKNPELFIQNLRPQWQGRIRFAQELIKTRNPITAAKELYSVKKWTRRISNTYKFVTNKNGFREKAIQNVVERITTRIENIGANIERAGQFIGDMVEGLSNSFEGINSAIGGIYEGIANLFEGAGLIGEGSTAAGIESTAVAAEGAVASAGIGATIAGLIGDLIAAIVPIFPVILILLVIIAPIIIILLLLGVGKADHPHCSDSYQTLYQDILYENTSGNPTKRADDLRKFAQDQWGINMVFLLDDKTSVNVANVMYDSICQLFGHAQGSQLDQQSANTFGNLAVGAVNPQSDRRSFPTRYLNPTFTIYDGAAPNDKNPPADCYVIRDPKKTLPDIGWIFANSSKCISSNNTVPQSTPKFQFLLARTLGYELYELQTFRKNKNYTQDTTLSDFKTQVFDVDPKLPTQNCAASQKPEDCFADMIGSYFTWGEYADFQISSANNVSGGQVGSLASEIVDTMKKPVTGGGCKDPNYPAPRDNPTYGVVNTSNYDCVNKLNPVPGTAEGLTTGKQIQDRLHLNTSENINLQCAGFVQAIGIGVGADIGKGADNSGNAYSYNGDAPVSYNMKGYTWISNTTTATMQVGDIPIWSHTGTDQTTGCEHIAVVVTDPISHQGPTSTNFTTAEANGFPSDVLNTPAGVVMYDHYTRIMPAFCTLHGWWRINGGGVAGHGAFTVHTTDDVKQAALAGVKYIIPYNWGVSDTQLVNQNDPLYQALNKANIKVIMDVSQHYYCQYDPVTQKNIVKLDSTTLANRVKVLRNSPLLIGYWSKDDDLHVVQNNQTVWCGSSMTSALQLAYQTIKRNDPNHFVMPGYGESVIIDRDYAPGEGDVLAFYPYPAYDGENAVADNVPAMLTTIRKRDKNPPPFVGIYQAFGGCHGTRDAQGHCPTWVTPLRSANLVIQDIQKFYNYGATGIIAFGWRAGDVDATVNNSSFLYNVVSQVSAFLKGSNRN